MPEDEEEPNYCRIATMVALDMAREECSSNDKLIKEIKPIIGLTDDDLEEPADECDEVLTEGIDDALCDDFAGIRRWVMCRTWELLEADEVDTFEDAIEMAWDEAHEKCEEIGSPI